MRVPLVLPVIAVVMSVTCAGSIPDPTATPTSAPAPSLAPATAGPFLATSQATPQATTPSIGSGIELSSGELSLPAAGAFGEAGFHEVLTASTRLPDGIGVTSGLRLVLALWDTTRPTQSCDSQHPLSGCATVDWSDAVGRPKVPAGGVFDNRIVFSGGSGERVFFVSASGRLNDGPDRFQPG